MRTVLPLLLLLLLASCADEPKRKIIVLGIDGMDPRLTDDLLAKGKLPNLKALAEEGGYKPLGTSIPPESPVAWSNFITGMNPGGHGIFDFLHGSWSQVEHEATEAKAAWTETMFMPVDSIASAEDVGFVLPLFGYELPLSGGDPINKRRGTPFWEILEDHDIPATVFKIPADYPPTETDQKTLSGMGTPDVQGGYGRYYLYTDDPFAVSDNIESGKVITVAVYDNVIRDFLYGPDNTLIAVEEGEDYPTTQVPIRVDIDPTEPIVRIQLGDAEDGRQVVVKEGEWSDFVQADFDIIPYVTGVTGIVRFHLQEIRPTFRLFVDPINISPLAPAFDISTPSDWVSEIAEKSGLFMTKGMPENTKALEEGVLTYDEMREHSLLIYNQRKKMLFDLLEDHDSGMFFYYFSSIDLNSHMFWRCMDPAHPGHSEETSNDAEQFIEWLYTDLDKAVGEVRKRLGPDDTLLVMSDHGFSPFYRSFNLNTWLLENGYAVLKKEALDDDGKPIPLDRDEEYWINTDWEKTRAFNLGFAGIYLNVKGRDPAGCVDPSEVNDLVDEICHKLMQEKDPENGKPVFLTMYKTREAYSGEAMALAPEIVTGFSREYRNSNESALGAYPEEVIFDNMDAWSGCHLMAAEAVPGVIFSNRKIELAAPKLYDLTATILTEYGIEIPSDMVGRPLWVPRTDPRNQ